MVFLEDVAGGPEVDGQFVDLAGCDERRMLLRFAVAGAQDTFGEVLREAVGPDVDEFRGEIGVGCGGFGEEFDADWAGDFGVLRERRALNKSEHRRAIRRRADRADRRASGRYRSRADRRWSELVLRGRK